MAKDEQKAVGRQPVFMGDVVNEEDKTEDLFGDAKPGEGIGKVEDFDEDLEEDSEPKKVPADPGQPTQAEVDDHNVDHYPTEVGVKLAWKDEE